MKKSTILMILLVILTVFTTSCKKDYSRYANLYTPESFDLTLGYDTYNKATYEANWTTDTGDKIIETGIIFNSDSTLLTLESEGVSVIRKGYVHDRVKMQYYYFAKPLSYEIYVKAYIISSKGIVYSNNIITKGSESEYK